LKNNTNYGGKTMVLYILRNINDLIDNLEFAKIILYKHVELERDKYQIWMRAGCLAYRGEVNRETFEKIQNRLNELRKLGKNVIEFREIIDENSFYTL